MSETSFLKLWKLPSFGMDKKIEFRKKLERSGQNSLYIKLVHNFCDDSVNFEIGPQKIDIFQLRTKIKCQNVPYIFYYCYAGDGSFDALTIDLHEKLFFENENYGCCIIVQNRRKSISYNIKDVNLFIKIEENDAKNLKLFYNNSEVKVNSLPEVDTMFLYYP